jgi:hypothetical protein
MDRYRKGICRTARCHVDPHNARRVSRWAAVYANCALPLRLGRTEGRLRGGWAPQRADGHLSGPFDAASARLAYGAAPSRNYAERRARGQAGR